MATDKARARNIESLRKAVRQKHPMDIIVCRPENEDAVRDLVEEAGVDMRIVIDPEAHGFMSLPNRPHFEEKYPELARQMTERPPQLTQEQQKPQTELQVEAVNTAKTMGPVGANENEAQDRPEIRIIIHDSGRAQTVRVQTGRKGTSIHLGG
jgi:hypothetical protein